MTGYCGSCRQECEAVLEDVSVDEHVRWGVISNCCEDTVFHDETCTDPVTASELMDEHAENEAILQVDLADMEDVR